MIRVVLDTNVVVSALIWGGLPFRWFIASENGDVQLATSPALIAELAGVLARPHLAGRLQGLGRTIETALAAYAGLVAQVTPVDVPRVVPGDADDDQVIATAVLAGAAIIVSGDRHLIGLDSYKGIRILTPADALVVIFTEHERDS